MTGEEKTASSGKSGTQSNHDGALAIPGPLLTEIADMKTSLTLAHKNHEELSLEVKRLASALLETDREITSLKDTNAKLFAYTKDLEDSILAVDTSSRKKNLIITGVGEVSNETSEILCEYLFELFSQYIDTLEIADFDLAYRLGNQNTSRKHPRPILVKFTKESTRNLVAGTRSSLGDDESLSSVFLNDDLPKKANDRRIELRMVLKLAREQNIPAKISGDKICVNNITYDHSNLDCLPVGLRLEDAKVKTFDGITAFQSKYAWLSNFFPCRIHLQGIDFNSGEHAFQYIKARRNGCPELATRILKSNEAKDAKQAGYGITILENWDGEKEEMMSRVIEAKFKQNPELAQKLIATGDSTLVEATSDRFWGAHATLNSKSLKEKNWEGNNVLGQLLMTLREDLRRDTAWQRFADCPNDSMSRPPTADQQSQRAALFDNMPTPPPRAPKGPPPSSGRGNSSGYYSYAQQVSNHPPSGNFSNRRGGRFGGRRPGGFARGGRGSFQSRGRQSQYSRGNQFSARGNQSQYSTRGNQFQHSVGANQSQYPAGGSYSADYSRGQGQKRNVRSPPVNAPVTSKQRVASDSDIDLFLASDTTMPKCSASPTHEDHSICIGSQVM